MLKKTKLHSLSVFFPCYNEEKNLPLLLRSALEILPKVAEEYEIIVVNDGSTDNTSKIAHNFAVEYDFIKIVDQENQGYGGAINTGFQHAQYEWVFFTDADLQFDLNDLTKFVESITAESDLIIGYRKNRAEGFKRYLFAKGMKLWNFLWLGFPLFIKDIDCAFKLIRRDVVKSFLPLYSKGNLVTSEFLLTAHKKGYNFQQIGVTHYKRKYGMSKCGNVTDVFKVVQETFALRTLVKKHTKVRLAFS